MGGEFELTVRERSLRGVSIDGTTLRIGTSGKQRIEAALLVVSVPFALALAASMAAPGDGTFNGFEVHHPVPVVVAGVLVAIGLAVQGTVLIRASVVATPDGVQLRHWCRRTLRWDEIADIQVVDTMPQRSGEPGGLTLAQLFDRRWAESVGIIVDAEGRAIVLPSCRSTARSEGWSAGGPTLAEQKVAVLRRYRDRIVGSEPPRPQVMYRDVQDGPPLVVAVAIAVGAPVALWTVLNMATDAPIAVGVMLIWVAPWVAIVFGSRRRAG